MGCQESTSAPPAGMSEQEKELAATEKSLGVHKIKAQEFVLHFKKYSFTPEAKEGEKTTSTMSLQQFRQAAGSVGLDIEKVMSPDSPEAKFYRQFYAHNKYDSRLLNILGIMLGQGTLVEKATLLYEEYDLNCDGNISNDECLEALNNLYTVSVEFLPTLDTTVSERQDVKPYLNKVKSAKEAGINKLRGEIVGESYAQVDRAGFTQKVASAQIMSASHFRTYFHAIGEAQAATPPN